jgi:hypothetical protein
MNDVKLKACFNAAGSSSMLSQGVGANVCVPNWVSALYGTKLVFHIDFDLKFKRHCTIIVYHKEGMMRYCNSTLFFSKYKKDMRKALVYLDFVDSLEEVYF